MPRCVLLFVALLLVPAAANAQDVIDLAWHKCRGLIGSAANLNYACDGSANLNPYRLVFAFRAPANLSQFVGIQAVLDMDTDDPILPDWWRLGVGECREGNLMFPASLLGVGNTTTCLNPWAGSSMTGGGFQWTSGYAYPSRGRCLFAFARDTPTTLVANQRYIGGVLTLDTIGDVETGSGVCAGCHTPACIGFPQVELYQVAGQTPPQQDIYILTSGFYGAYVTWQGGALTAVNCPKVIDASRRSSWGAIKTTYR